MDSDFIYGINPILEALEQGKLIDKILVRKGKSDESIEPVRQAAKHYQVPLTVVPQEKLDRITRKNHQGCIALTSPIDFYRIEHLLPEIFRKGEMPLLMVLDGVTDVRNFGAIARTCLAAGFHSIIIPSSNFARVGADAIKTSAGALMQIPICRELQLARTVQFLQDSGIQVVAATEKADLPYYNTDFKVPTAIVMGSEDDGISDAIIRKADLLRKIPMNKRFDSLNVSVAAGIFAFEAVRQRIQ
jgi:23S rRNA (guanosine2251-2'-O)-methyltransferase